MKKLLKEEFIKRAKIIHKDFYDYSLVNYKNLETKVKIICPIHGTFQQTPASHMSGRGCPKCGRKKTSEARIKKNDIFGKRKVFNTEEFIKRAKIIHKDFYDYSLVNYICSNKKVKIICPIHGIFEQIPNNHLRGYGCLSCSKIQDKKFLKNSFLKKAFIVHKNFYDYSLVDYKNAKTKVKIICPIHGVFEQTPGSHLRGRGCPKCGIKKFTSSRKLTTKEFIERAKIIHNNFYDYSLVNYVYNNKKVKIICPIHGVFEQTPKSHVRGHGCPSCASSLGENKIENFLINKKIPFEKQKTFKDCVYKYKLRFDFYLPESNSLIEYHGIQHYKVVEYFGGEEGFNKRKIRDKLKKDFAKLNNIKLIEISYNDNIEEELNENM